MKNERREVSKDEFDMWVSSYPGPLETLVWTSTDSTAYYDNNRYPPHKSGGWDIKGIVGVVNWYFNPELRYYVFDDMLIKANDKRI